jgi:hypothetical protein
VTGDSVRIVAALVYLTLGLAWVYAVVDAKGHVGDGAVIAGLVAASLAVGAIVARWWALLLPLALVVLALPAGDQTEDAAGDIESTALVVSLSLTWLLPAVVLGIAGAWLVRRLRGRAPRRPAPDPPA